MFQFGDRGKNPHMGIFTIRGSPFPYGDLRMEMGRETKTLAARGLEERRNFEELLTESVGRVHFS